MADAERGLGRLDRALEVVHSPEAKRLPRAAQIELRIVESGIRRDQGLADAAVLALQVPELTDGKLRPWSARLFYAYGEALLAAGRREAAREAFSRAVVADEDEQTDALARLDELDGITVADLEDDEDDELDDDLLDDDDDLDDEDDDDDEDDERRRRRRRRRLTTKTTTSTTRPTTSTTTKTKTTKTRKKSTTSPTKTTTSEAGRERRRRRARTTRPRHRRGSPATDKSAAERPSRRAVSAPSGPSGRCRGPDGTQRAGRDAEPASPVTTRAGCSSLSSQCQIPPTLRRRPADPLELLGDARDRHPARSDRYRDSRPLRGPPRPRGPGPSPRTAPPGSGHPHGDLLGRPLERRRHVGHRPVVAEQQPGRPQRGELAQRRQRDLQVEVRRRRRRPQVAGLRDVDPAASPTYRSPLSESISPT